MEVVPREIDPPYTNPPATARVVPTLPPVAPRQNGLEYLQPELLRLCRLRQHVNSELARITQGIQKAESSAQNEAEAQQQAMAMAAVAQHADELNALVQQRAADVVGNKGERENQFEVRDTQGVS